MKVYIIGIVTILLLSGCATTPIPSAQAKPVPSDRLLAYQEKKAETTSTLVVTRDVGFAGSACLAAVEINQITVARLDVGETARFFLSPGEITVGIASDTKGEGICGLGEKITLTDKEIVLHVNEVKFFRISIIPSLGLELLRVDK